MLMAVTRTVSSAIAGCELSFIERKPIDIERARAQHHAYEDLLRKLGAQVLSLAEEPVLPDSMFVEDPAIVLDAVAIICSLGTETRRKEAPSIAAALEKFRPLVHINLPGTLEGGDVLRVGRQLYVGLTERSNAEGIRQLAVIAAAHGYDLTALPVTGCLHLKSAVTFIGKNTLLGNRAWFPSERIGGFDWVEVDPGEAHAGNALLVGDTVVFPASFPRTAERVQAKGFKVVLLDISELQKAESGLTCSSLLFEVGD
jgi:dimethylargininase